MWHRYPITLTTGTTTVSTSQKNTSNHTQGFEPGSLGSWLLLPRPQWWSGLQYPLSPDPASCHTPCLCLARSCKCHLLQGGSSAFSELPPEPFREMKSIHTLPQAPLLRTPPPTPLGLQGVGALCAVLPPRLQRLHFHLRPDWDREDLQHGGGKRGIWVALGARGWDVSPDVAPHLVPRAHLRTPA